MKITSLYITWQHFVDALFNWCVKVLVDGAHLLGMTYNEINIWIFCIIEPVVFLLMLVVIILQYIKIRRSKSMAG